ncbi:MAG: site-specific DNA-methyltransferase [Leptospiraceae bacterium]|nr:site-specific DNA-methyltransferase [Leptospiraceae bacterium]MDW8306235.1 site-specific DNA-methyltransferase [Leptospiraceae bacterium]
MDEFAINQVYNEDSLQALPKLPSDSFDLIICDGPYGRGEFNWDKKKSVQEFNLYLIKEFSRILKKGGVLYLFGKHDLLDFIDYRPYLLLHRRIIWYIPSSLAQGRRNYTNNYDVIAYFSKGRVKTFNLDDIRVPQLVELEHRRRCENVPSVKSGRYGKTKFNDRGKNPGDVWGDIKPLTYRSRELLDYQYLHTVQKPLKLMERLIRASSQPQDLVLDPFAGTGTALVAAKKLDRQYLGFEIDSRLYRICKERLALLDENKALAV